MPLAIVGDRVVNDVDGAVAGEAVVHDGLRHAHHPAQAGVVVQGGADGAGEGLHVDGLVGVEVAVGLGRGGEVEAGAEQG